MISNNNDDESGSFSKMNRTQLRLSERVQEHEMMKMEKFQKIVDSVKTFILLFKVRI
jgi:hypothetical protein